MSKLKLFCIPYAGGTSIVYSKWRQYLDSRVELHAVELAGRGKRVDDKLYDDLKHAVDDIYESIKNEICNGSYALFGHSMGSLLAYELYYKIREQNLNCPVHIFFSGYKAPNIGPSDGDENYHDLPENCFKKKLVKLGGMPKEILEDAAFKFFSPIIRADFKILELYKYVEKNERIGCPVSVFSGKKDKGIKVSDLTGWKQHTELECNIHKFNGGHFFIKDDMENVLGAINNTLLKYIY